MTPVALVRAIRAMLLSLAWSGGLLVAQDPAALTPEAIAAQAKAVAENAQLEQAVKDSVASVYATAIEAAQAAATSKAKVAAALTAIAAAPQLLADKRAQSAVPVDRPTPEELARLELPRLEERLRAAQAARDQATLDLQAKEAERQQRAARILALPALIVGAGEERSKLQATPIDSGPNDAAVLVEARRIRRAARLLAMAARVEELEVEKRLFEAEAELLTAQRDHLDRVVAAQTTLVEVIDRAVQERRRADAAADLRTAGEQAQTVHPVLVPIAEANQQLTAARQQWITALAAARADLKLRQETRQGLEKRFAEIEKRIQLAGRTDAIGLQLRQEKSRLPAVRDYLARIELRRSKLVAAQIEQLDREDQLKLFQQQRDATLAAALEALPAATPAATRASVESKGRELLDRREEYLTSLVNDVDAYIRALVDLDTEERLIVQKSKFYGNYVNERVLWIRSTVPIWKTDWDLAAKGVAWFLSGESWRSLGSAVVTTLERSPGSLLSVTLLALLLIGLGRPARRRIALLADEAANYRTTGIAPTLWTLVMTIVAAAGWPLLIWHLATEVQATPGIGEFAGAIAGGLMYVAVMFAAAELFRQVMRPAGLAEAHLRWPPARTRLIRVNLAWFLPIFLSLAFLLGALTLHGYAPWGFTLDRLLLIAMLIAIAVFLARLLDPQKGALAHAVSGGVSRRKGLWYGIGIAAPIILALLAAGGYHFTALELFYRLELSLGVVGFAVLIDGLGLRWMLLAKRKLAIAKATAKREAAKAKAAEGGAEIQREGMPLLDETLNLASVDAQSRKLLSGGLLLAVVVGLWSIWSDVLPALRVFDSYTAWNNASEVTRIVDGKAVVETVFEPVTWGSILLGLLIVLITVAAARNIPGLLELALLQRLRSGERYAAMTLVRYLIVTVGVVFAFSSIGVGWGKIQWLVAAVSVGLGFGLQEIFANFVSGIIILFERPVRVGDLVTVGGVDGYVTRIRMRATTIIDYDRKELIVPNKEFVTSRLVNWTLTDPITRVVLTVGIAYGSDTKLARQLLLQAAKENPLVLETPAPSALFRKFGESSLDFDLRVFLGSRDLWPQVIDSLHSAIDQSFRDAGIEIAFPQRDLHIRTVGSLADIVEKRDASAGRHQAQ